MKQAPRLPLIDVHDKDLTPEIYQLLFTIIECKGNDLHYELMVWPDDWDENDYSDEFWKKRWEKTIARGPNNCYHNHEAMKEFCANPSKITDAVINFRKWLNEKGVDNEPIIVKLWW